MPSNAITDWGTALMTSLASALTLFLNAIPRIIGFLLIVVIGWWIASIISGLVASILRRVRFNDVADRSGITGFIRSMGLSVDAAGLLADIVKWFIRLIVLIVAFDQLGLASISFILNQFLLWLPSLVVALVVLVIGGILANGVYNLVRGSAAVAGLGSPITLASLARAAVWIFAIMIALNQIGVASSLVNILFMGFVAALAIALGLAFGLGGRETAGMIVRDWYERSQHASAGSRSTIVRERRSHEGPEEPRHVA